jgi:dUTP pyrophosphatase
VNRHVYLAYPIDQAGRNVKEIVKTHSQVGWAKSRLEATGYGCYDPGRAWSAPSAGIVLVNDAALRHAAGVLAWLPAGVPSIGVPMEIERALGLGLPVQVVTDVASFALPAETMAESTEEAVATLEAEMKIRSYDQQVGTVGLPVKLHSSTARLPTRGYPDDAGLDMYVSQRTVIPAGGFADVPTEIAVALPPGVWGMVVGRSSTIRTRRLLAIPGIMDTGYRGAQFSAVYNLGDASTVAQVGERLTQLILFPNITQDYVPVQVQQVDQTARGERGFGSTGQ